MQLTNWTPEHSAALREYHAKGMSYSEIADAINAKFKTSYSRCAAIGRAKRLGLAGPNRPGDRPKSLPRAKAPRRRKLRKRHASGSLRLMPMPVFEAVAPVKLRCVEIVPRHLALVDLEPGDCRYPYGGDEEGEAISFCGHPKRENSSYCTAHFHLTCGPGTASERAAGTATLRLVGGGMKRGPKLTPAVMVVRMKRLPRRHRIARLRGLMAQQPAGSVRKEELAALLREEMTVLPGKKPAPDASPLKRAAQTNTEFNHQTEQ
jgi:GcrA cell cycle regulator